MQVFISFLFFVYLFCLLNFTTFFLACLPNFFSFFSLVSSRTMVLAVDLLVPQDVWQRASTVLLTIRTGSGDIQASEKKVYSGIVLYSVFCDASIPLVVGVITRCCVVFL